MTRGFCHPATRTALVALLAACGCSNDRTPSGAGGGAVTGGSAKAAAAGAKHGAAGATSTATGVNGSRGAAGSAGAGEEAGGATSEASCADAPDTSASTPATAVDDTLMVTGPITGGMGKPFTATAADLPGAGYTEKEFFFEGQAAAYSLPGGMTMDGKWSLSPASNAAFKTRVLVRRPMDPCKFNGTLVVEWLNVSAGADGDPGFMYNAEEILREGYAWAGISAQAAGVEGGGFSLGGTGALPLKQQDPGRYGSLKHPGDEYSFDIYSLGAKVLRGGGSGVSPLEGLKPERVIAYGESQSAMRMVSYVDGVQPIAMQYDGFFIHSRGGGGVPFDSSGGLGALLGGGGAVFIRDDISAKVFQFQTETDVAGMGYVSARQPDSDRLRSWEVAGTAHADQYIVDFNKSLAPESGMPVSCDGANNGPQHFVIKAALHALDQWLRDGTEPPKGELLTTDASGALVRDENGNARGGVRSPDVDVPIETLSGEPSQSASNGSFWCFLFGSTTPFSPDKLMMLYPTHQDYVDQVKASAQTARDGGFLLEPEQQAMVSTAEAAAVPR